MCLAYPESCHRGAAVAVCPLSAPVVFQTGEGLGTLLLLQQMLLKYSASAQWVRCCQGALEWLVLPVLLR